MRFDNDMQRQAYTAPPMGGRAFKVTHGKKKAGGLAGLRKLITASGKPTGHPRPNGRY